MKELRKVKLKNWSSCVGLGLTLFFVLSCGMFRKEEPPPKAFDAREFNAYRGKLETLPEKKLGTYYGEKYGLKKIVPLTVPGAVEAIRAEYEISASWGSSYAPRPMNVEIVNYPSAEAAADRMWEVERQANVRSAPYVVNNQEIGRILIADNVPLYWTNGSLFCKGGTLEYHHFAKF